VECLDPALILPVTGFRSPPPGRIDVEELVISLMRASESRHTTPEKFNATLLAAEGDKKTSIPTFQRAFWRLHEQGVLQRGSVLGSGTQIQHFYELADQPRHVHFYCLICKQFEEIFDEQMIALHDRALARHGLAPARFGNALTGTCAACQACQNGAA